jgi:hypothetical protein
MRIPRWALVTAILVAAAAATVGVGSGSEVAADDPTGGRITPSAPQRIRDTRNAGGAPVKQLTAGPGVLAISALPSSGSGSMSVRTCGAAPKASDPNVFYSAGSTATLRVVRSDNACVYASTAIHMTVDRSGTVDTVPSPSASQYIPLASPIPLVSGFGQLLAPGSSITLGRPAELPSDATAAVVAVEAADAGLGYVTVKRCGGSPGSLSTMAFPTSFPSAVEMPMIGPADTLCLVGQNSGTERFDVDVELIGYLSPVGPNPMSLPPMYSMASRPSLEPGFAPINPRRALDTRNGIGCSVDGDDCVSRLYGVTAQETVVVGVQDYVTEWTTALAMNVTVTETEFNGFLTVWPCDEDMPDASNLNWTAGETRANHVISKFESGDRIDSVCIRAQRSDHSSTTVPVFELIVDITGVFDFAYGSAAQGVAPKRLLDTRNAIGVPGRSRVGAGHVLALDVTGRGGVPDDVDAVTMNVTAVEPVGDGFLTVWPCDEPMPDASNVNHPPGRNVPNLVTVGVSAQGTVCFYTYASTHVLADVAAWYGDGGTSGLVERTPKRLLDTRNGVGSPQRKANADEMLVLSVRGRGGVAADAGSVVMNVTVTAPETDGFLTVWPCGVAMPNVSNLNFRAGDTVPNLVSVKLSATGTVCMKSTARADLIADVAGYLTTKKTTLPTIVLV